MTEPKKIADILDHAADLIEPEGAWTQGAFARDADGEDTEEDNAGDPVCFCLYGAVGKAAGVHDYESFRDADQVIMKAIGAGTPGDVAKWNDAEGRRQPEVVAVLRRAADIARQGAA